MAEFLDDATGRLADAYNKGTVKIPQIDAMVQAQLGRRGKATKPLVKSFLREKILHAVPDMDVMYITRDRVVSKSVYQQSLLEVSDYVEEAAQPTWKAADYASAFDHALDWIAGARRLQFKGRAYELARLKEGTVIGAAKRTTEMMRQSFTRVKPLDLVTDMTGNAQAARAMQAAQQKAATVVAQLELELKGLGNATEGARVKFNEHLLQRLQTRATRTQQMNGISYSDASVQVFDEWLQTSLSIHFGVEIPPAQINQAIREVIALSKAPLPTSDLYARFQLVADHLASKDAKLLPPRTVLGVGPVHYVSTHLGYMVKADTIEILHKELGKVSRDWKIALPFLHDRLFPNKSALAEWLNSVMSSRYLHKISQGKESPKIRLPHLTAELIRIKYETVPNITPEEAALMIEQTSKKYIIQAQLWADYMLRYHNLYEPNNYKAAVSSFGGLPIPVILDKTEQDTLKALSRGVSNGQLQRVLDDLHVKSPSLATWAKNSIGALWRWNHAVTVSGLLGGAYAILPGFRFLGNNIVSAASIMTVTVGPKLAVKGAAGAARLALYDQIAKRMGRLTPETVRFTAATGIRYTEGDLLKLELENNIRDSQISHEFRAGMLKSIMRTANLQANATKSGVLRQGYRWIGDPAAKNFLSEFAVESDNAFRRGVFRTLIAEGSSPEQAAHKARMAMHDYSDLTRFETEYMTRFILFYTFRRQMMVATARAVLLEPSRLKHLYELHHILRGEEADWQQENTMYQARFFAKVSDNGDAYLTGYSDPSFDSVTQLGTLLDMPADPTGTGIKMAADFIFTPGTDYVEGLLKVDPKAPRNSSPGKVPARVVSNLMLLPDEQREWVMQELELGLVAADKTYSGGVRVGTTEDNYGYELQFETVDGYVKYLTAVFVMQRTGLYTGLMNWGLVATRATKPENLELGYLDDGSLVLYALGAQTPLRVPNIYKEQLTSMLKLEAELKALKQE
jgi:hypothetical protein